MKEAPVLEQTSLARRASAELAGLEGSVRNAILERIAEAIVERSGDILAANDRDMKNAQALLERGEISQAIVNRLKLTESKVCDIANGIRQVAGLPDPVGLTTMATQLDEGLELYRVTAPIGVLAVIFESRPDALPQIASLAIKSANAVLLKGGREAEHSLRCLFECIERAGKQAGLPEGSIVLLSTREDVQAILKADGLIDLIIPRGSSELVRHIQDNTRIPVLGHAEGICHVYVHEDGDLETAVRVAVDSKTQYPSACNAMETLLINQSVASELLPRVAKALSNAGVELRADEPALDLIRNGCPDCAVSGATKSDWKAEYCDLILSIKIVASLAEAIEHINEYGSGHTESIVTQDRRVFERFFKAVDSAGVFWNASTRFADGFRYGFGAEVGIATGKFHPRGPVGLDGLVTYKYRLEGNGQVVAEYSGPDAKEFRHKQISA